MDTIFDITVTHTGAVGGYTCAQRVAITGADTVNLKEKIIKKILSPMITTQNCITPFNPEELRTNDSNFFSFMGNWLEQTQTLHQHLCLHHMHNMCLIVQILQRLSSAKWNWGSTVSS